jgi:hypothetical protein
VILLPAFVFCDSLTRPRGLRLHRANLVRRRLRASAPSVFLVSKTRPTSHPRCDIFVDMKKAGHRELPVPRLNTMGTNQLDATLISQG